MTKRKKSPEAMVLLALLIAIWSGLAAFGLRPVAAQDSSDLGRDIDEQVREGAGSPGSDGNSDACVGECPGGDAGSSGRIGQSTRGRNSGGEGEQTGPTPTPTTASSANRTATTSRNRTTARTGASSRSVDDDSSSIQTILLYPETATPIPDPLPTSVAPVKEPAESEVSENESSSEQAARPVQERVRETSGGGFPARRVLGILAALVAVGAAWSLFMPGKRKPGRRSVGRRTPRRL